MEISNIKLKSSFIEKRDFKKELQSNLYHFDKCIATFAVEESKLIMFINEPKELELIFCILSYMKILHHEKTLVHYDSEQNKDVHIVDLYFTFELPMDANRFQYVIMYMSAILSKFKKDL